MALPAGTRLGPYEVLGLIGAGGMGEVYGARDTRLDRTVALKVLPQEFADDPSRRARLEREARAISALEHPHICTLHDVGEQDGRIYLVMEHLTGETLADRLRKGPMPRPQALDVAAQIADALDAAHKRGIVHRDLKPGNVMLSRSGVKLLDFGLARLSGPAGGPLPGNASWAPTAAAPLTGEHTLLGTLPYMAPEQLEGRPSDARTDLWTLGTVLYEMLTGRRAFEGRSQASLIGAILEKEPVPLSALLPLTPPSLERVLRRCLAKSPDERWDTAHDLAEELRWVAQSPQSTESPRPGHAPSRTLAAVAAVALTVGLLVGLAVSRRVPRRQARPVVQSLLDVRPADAILGPSPFERRQVVRRPSRTALAFSPDGSTLVFVGLRGERQQLYVRRLDQPEASAVPGTDGADAPFFSPDGAWVGYWAKGGIRKIALGGDGPPAEVCRFEGIPYGASWGTADWIVFAAGAGGLRKVPASGGTAVPLTTPAEGEAWHVLPHVLPGGKAVLFTALDSHHNWRSARVVAQDLGSGRRRVLAEDAADARYLPTGHVVFARRGNLLGFAFDATSLTREGGDVGLLTGVMQALNAPNYFMETGAAQFSVSESGALAFVPGGTIPTVLSRLVSVDRAGGVRPIAEDEHDYRGLHLSPDGKQLVTYIKEDLTATIYTYDIGRGVLTRLVPLASGAALFPRWAPSGDEIAFGWSGEGRNAIFLADMHGLGPPRLLVESDAAAFPSAWTPDGRKLVFVAGGSILVHEIDAGERATRPLLSTPGAQQVCPELSRDGRWLAYASDETGRYEVYIRSFPDMGGRVQVSADGGTSPLWSRDGRTLYYVARASEDVGGVLTEVAFSSGPPLALGAPRPLFDLEQLRLQVTHAATGYTLTPDGRGFVFARSAPGVSPPPPNQVHLVQNWLDELQRRMPAE